MNNNYFDSSTTIASLTRNLSLSLLLVISLCSPSFGQVKKAEIVDNPIVKDDQVTIRVKVKGKDDKPVIDLQDTNFSLLVDRQPVNFNSQDWKSAKETVPPPAWIIVLLDYSGSMRNRDKQGGTKLQGAINAIREFNQAIAERGGNTHIAIVPFGEPGTNCVGNPVTKQELDKFFSAGDVKIKNNLDYLANQIPCASTNIYQPLTKAIRFLGDTTDQRFYVEKNSNQPQPRLSVILLSDGYHNKPNEAEDFEQLIDLLKRNPQIVVHTLGYGLTPEQLGRKYALDRPAKRSDIGQGLGTVPEDEFVDRERLAAIANASGGIAAFSPDAKAVTEKLNIFLDALLGEYEITYTEPNPRRYSVHNVSVKVDSKVISDEKPYRMGGFGNSLPLQVRIVMLLLVFIALVGGGFIPFSIWADKLKREAEEG